MDLEWRIIGLEKRNPHLIAALDESISKFVSENKSDPTIIYHKWEPSVSISRYQDADDINLEKCDQLGIKYVRTYAGGRADIHFPDKDFSYSLFLPAKNSDFANSDRSTIDIYNFYCKKMADALKELGLPVRVVGNNDLYIGKKKLSGNGQRIENNVIVQHGIIVYDLPNINNMIEVMNKNLYNGTSVNDLNAIMTYIKEYKDVTMEEVTKTLTKHLINNKNFNSSFYYGDISKDELDYAKKLVKEKYSNINWEEKASEVRGLCWLPRGAPIGTYKGENPV